MQNTNDPGLIGSLTLVFFAGANGKGASARGRGEGGPVSGFAVMCRRRPRASRRNVTGNGLSSDLSLTLSHPPHHSYVRIARS